MRPPRVVARRLSRAVVWGAASAAALATAVLLAGSTIPAGAAPHLAGTARAGVAATRAAVTPRADSVARVAGNGTPAPSVAWTASIAAPPCMTPGLVVWLDTQGNGAAGSTYYNLELTNLSGHACSLDGYPYVYAVKLSGADVGPAARFDPVHPAVTVTLANGATATSVLRIVDAGNFPPSTCKAVTAAGLRVYPPNQTRAKVVPFPFPACSSSTSVLMVETVQKA